MSNKMFVYGRHACSAILNNPKRQILNVWVRQGDESRHQDLIEMAKARQLNLQIQAPAYFQKNFAEDVHQGVVLEVRALERLNEADIIPHLDALSHPPMLLILDGVTDPHNLGACLRTADAVGVDMVIIPKDKSAGLSPIVTKVSSGASESVALVHVTNLARTIEKIQQWGVWVYGACGEASESLYALDGRQAIALILGAEGHGLRRLTREKCDGLFSIPMMGMVSSLNVSVAAGVSLYELRRQRGGNESRPL
jgi:23S rRNA (guanosine2251-2'-O)-methyltransferase